MEKEVRESVKATQTQRATSMKYLRFMVATSFKKGTDCEPRTVFRVIEGHSEKALNNALLIMAENTVRDGVEAIAVFGVSAERGFRTVACSSSDGIFVSYRNNGDIENAAREIFSVAFHGVGESVTSLTDSEMADMIGE